MLRHVQRQFHSIIMPVVSSSESCVDIGLVVGVRKSILVNQNVDKISYWCITTDKFAICYQWRSQ